jgi:hypothetical protein
LNPPSLTQGQALPPTTTVIAIGEDTNAQTFACQLNPQILAILKCRINPGETRNYAVRIDLQVLRAKLISGKQIKLPFSERNTLHHAGQNELSGCTWTALRCIERVPA